jgi:hypothetical protein
MLSRSKARCPQASRMQGGRQKGAANARKRSRSSSVRALGRTVRLRDKNHRKFILRQPCLVCGRVPSDLHHLTFTQPRALGRRVSDEFVVPVCRVHHRELHRSGDEAAWWRRLNIDPLPVALRLWQHTRGDGELAPAIQAQAAKTPEVAAHDQARASRAARTEPKPVAQGAVLAEPQNRATVARATECRPQGINMLQEMTLCEEVFHTASGIAFADFVTECHRETWPIRSKRFRTWLRRCYYQATGVAPSGSAIRSALDLLEARAQFDGPERAVNIRVAENTGRLYLDLADEHWRAVAIGPNGWQVIGCSPVRFRRSAGMLSLPVPERGGSIEALRSFLNLSNQNDFVLVVAWLLAALRAGGPYPLLAMSGEQGSAKTVLSKLLRALVDPNVAPVRALPREERELMIAANNGHLLAFDNLSGLPAWLSDALWSACERGQFRGPPALHRRRGGAV